jgi:hypothetical protein
MGVTYFWGYTTAAARFDLAYFHVPLLSVSISLTLNPLRTFKL